MIFFRCVAIALPQILILLLVGSVNDMLGGWNQTSDAMTTVVTLFLLGPITALALLITEIVKCYKANRGERRRTFSFIGLAVALLVQSLAIDLYLLSQLRM
jgi:uncharacterized membrane protein